MAPPSRRPERHIVIAALTAHEGSVTAVAGYFQVSPRTVHRWLNELGIKVRREVVEATQAT